MRCLASQLDRPRGKDTQTEILRLRGGGGSCRSHVQRTTNPPADQRHASDRGQDWQQKGPAEPGADCVAVNKRDGCLKLRHLRCLMPQQWGSETNGSSRFHSSGGSGQNPRVVPYSSFPHAPCPVHTRSGHPHPVGAPKICHCHSAIIPHLLPVSTLPPLPTPHSPAPPFSFQGSQNNPLQVQEGPLCFFVRNPPVAATSLRALSQVLPVS